jgi:hypothetical protein
MDAHEGRPAMDRTLNEVKTQVMIRVLKDHAFAERVVRDPRAAVLEACGVSLPPELDIRVLQATDSYLPLVIPPPLPGAKGRTVEEIERTLLSEAGSPAGDLQNRLAAQARLLARSWTDAAYKSDLLQDPKRTLEREFALQLPSGVTVEAFEESAATSYLVLPPAPNPETGELTDEQLELVAGGITPVTPLVIFFTILGTALTVAGTILATISNN